MYQQYELPAACLIRDVGPFSYVLKNMRMDSPNDLFCSRVSTYNINSSTSSRQSILLPMQSALFFLRESFFEIFCRQR